VRPVELDQNILNAALGDLPLGGIRYYPQVGSTNDLAITWAGEGATDNSLVIADEQTSGRGRNGRKWYSPAGASLTFSLILKPGQEETRSVGLFTALAALAVVQAIQELPGNFIPKIKWPNDVLVNDRKVCGILTETTWVGDKIESLVIGVGINVTAESVPSAEYLNYPATSLEEVSCSRIDRIQVLQAIVKGIFYWRSQLGEPPFLAAWESSLAFLGEQVKVRTENGPSRLGTIQGLDKDGGLILKDGSGDVFSVHTGEVHLEHPGL
jgi:BirA family biotin operon repressor/biotin-[acetyl-CoA-carboxylase] ligase